MRLDGYLGGFLETSTSAVSNASRRYDSSFEARQRAGLAVLASLSNEGSVASAGQRSPLRRMTVPLLTLLAVTVGSGLTFYHTRHLAWPDRALGLRLLLAVQAAGISIVGVRLLSYFHSFVLHWQRYRLRADVTTHDLKRVDVPYVRVHVTTRGLPGSAEVILRGIRNILQLANEDPIFYADFLTIEICTESQEQAELFRGMFGNTVMPVPIRLLVVPEDYETPKGTLKKARSLHYMVEHRRAGWGRRPGKTYVLHFDEESVIEPGEMRKLLRLLATSDKKILEGPIYYPLEYAGTSALCRAMEANRPIGCFECRTVMESGMPLHLHGSNLVVEEEFENQIGWDFGTLDGQPFIAEDYVFGMLAFLNGGRQAFGWHGTVMLEQPPFSYRSAFKQRQRWITGVLQGQQMLLRMERFRCLPVWLRLRVLWGTRFRILSFAMGAPVGALFFGYLVLVASGALPSGLTGRVAPPLPIPMMAWLSLVGFMWLAAVFIGAWLNVAHARVPLLTRLAEIGKVMTIAPVAGVFESMAGLWAVMCWTCGQRQVSWQPTPKTKDADQNMNWSRG